MRWCKEYGVAVDYWQYRQLPLAVLEDCRLVMRAQAQLADLQDTKKPTQDLIAKELAGGA